MISGQIRTGAFRQNSEVTVLPPLVIFAPYPPAKSGIADYVAELMPYYTADFDVTLVVADDAPEPDIPPCGPRVLLASEFRKHREFFSAAAKLYHIGNNPMHCYMLDLLERDRGIVVLHDYCLNYLHDAASLGWHEPDGYRQAHELEFGSIGADGTRWMFQRKERGQFATYELPLNGDVLEAATAVITHSRYAQYKAAARVPRTPVWYVPHHLTPSVDEYSKLTKIEARRQLGVPEQELFVTALGFVTYAKRIHLLLSALSDPRNRVPEFRLILGGEKRPGEYDVDAEIAAVGLKGKTISTGYLDEARFFRHLVASDIIVNLRHPTGGESSGTLIRAMGIGRPVVVLDHGPIGEVPDDVVAKIPWGDDTQQQLTKTLQELMTSASLRSALGRRAAAYARNVHDIGKIAARHSRIIRSVDVRPPAAEQLTYSFASARSIAQSVIRPNSDAAAKAGSADGSLWWLTGAAPLVQNGRRAILIASNPNDTAALLSELFGWPLESILAFSINDFLAPKLRADGAPVKMGAFPFALCVVPADLSENRAAGLLRRLNAAIARGGVLTLEVVCSVDKGSAATPLAADRLSQRLADAGFAVLKCPTPRDGVLLDLYVEENRTAGDSTSACILARKVSTFSTWRYVEQSRGMPSRLGGRLG